MSLEKGKILDLDISSKGQQSSTVFKDRTPYENKGTLTDVSLTTDHKGQTDKAGSFNGSTSVIRVSDSSEFNVGSTMSAFCWVKGAAGLDDVVFSQYDFNINQRSWRLSTGVTDYENILRVIISDDGTFNDGHKKDYITTSTVFDNTWHFIGFTFDSGILKVYVNGVEADVTKTTDNAITSVHNSTADLTIGCCLTSNTPVQLFAGSIERPMVWNRVLSDDEILTLYQSYNPKLKISSTGLG